MPVPPAVTTTQTAASLAPGADGVLRHSPGQTQSTNTSANPNAQMQLVGTDAVTFSAQSNPAAPVLVTVTFPNLPKRAVQNNPLTPINSSKNGLHIAPQSSLLLHVFVMGGASAVGGLVISASPQAITKDGAVVPGPFLGAEDYLTFQAVVSIANATLVQAVSGSVGAHLSLAHA